MGIQVLNLPPEDLQLAEEEVKEAINHNLDERDYIEMGLDFWERKVKRKRWSYRHLRFLSQSS